VTTALKQEVPLWLDVIIAAFVAGAAFTLATGADFLAKYLV